MMMPSIFGENLFDDWMDSVEEEFFGRKNPLYGKHAKNMMKTDVRETDGTYEVDIEQYLQIKLLIEMIKIKTVNIFVKKDMQEACQEAFLSERIFLKKILKLNMKMVY